MKAIEFDEVNVRVAEHQEEYETLPAHYNEEDSSVAFGFELSKEELEQIQKTGTIWIKQLTFGRAMQPIAVSTSKEELI